MHRPPIGRALHDSEFSWRHVYNPLILSVIAFALHVFGAERQMIVLILYLAAVTPFVMFREFARRYSFANMLIHQALALDVAVSIILLISVLGLAFTNQLSAITCLAALGFSCAISSGVWLFVKRRAFKRKPSVTYRTICQSWVIGKWLLFGQMARQVQGYAAHWITLLIGGAVATGLYSAYLSIVALANPFLFGFFNVLTPKFVRTLNERGPAALRRQACLDTLVVIAIMGSFALLISLFGELLMTTIFPGEEYARNARVLTVLAFAHALGAIGGTAIIGLTTVEKTRAVAGLALLTALLGSSLVWILMSTGGLEAAAYGILITECIASALTWAIFIRATSTADTSLSDSLALHSASPSPSAS